MTFMNRLNLLAQIASKRTDVIIVAFMLMAIAMMIIPLPTYLVDALIGVNIALSLLILIVAFYINHSVEFSALPPLILLSTLFRLSLSITTTRLILLDGNAGHIVKAFGDFVIAGQVVVGLVVFLIITVAQFVVITKGAERVAEVAARFTLDAMPGKQMSIDNDLRNGDIDQAEARRRRSRLERESQMFGAMDGAMKFVKGDAIAGLVILFVNLLGGMMIGMVERGMPFAEAAHTYSLLTVGDGLIAQIPALLISVAAGTVVTRVNSDGEERDLGTEIVRQLGASHRALGLTALILLGVGLLPGFPLLVFVTLAAVLGGSAVVLWRRARTGASVPAIDLPDDELAMEPDAPEVLETFERPLDSRVLLSVGDGLAQVAPLQPLRQRIEALCHEIRADLGIDMPVPEVYLDRSMSADRFQVELEGVPVCEGEFDGQWLLLQDDPVHAQLLAVEPREAPSPISERSGRWVEREHASQLQEAGIGFLFADEVLREVLDRTLRRYAADFLGIQETRVMLEQLEGKYGELIKEVLRILPLQRVAEALRLLVAEGVSIRNRRGLLEAMVEWGSRESDAGRLTEHLRAGLARQISHQYADRNRVISAFVLAPALEEQLRAAISRLDKGRDSVPDDIARTLLVQLRRLCDLLPENDSTVLLVHPELRRGIRRMIVRGELQLAVLSFRELAGEYNLQAVGTLSLTDINTRPASGAGSVSSLATAS
ncbi:MULTISPECIES: type III secretion system export apparatus subunit SctV [Pseudomonas syringae group]|uniref:Type III secretion system export apparatus subunit SctV n=1 Tax=Pseudomonas viridiflava TaxID=33069 RepID=A0ABU7NB14_PSEVI|nr:type III secretion system export apparatus subunit SctV [Pseudomonas viridiflava]MBD8804400.1 type III secretion system export apparatus subunit SctV [Pseudomonas syringae]MBI6576582.1 type III secretion system export apparatus subunit SctV [Pseudomonas viridiflava]MBI6609140.1 type III secretion system export apparatus subunit SctV [Pseudomonas viridiflava]MBI6640777.1 type III secretion system export apparatus subunit SctV [Pseudomonas viridiflava]MBI6866028.1 type III secretion system ex